MPSKSETDRRREAARASDMSVLRGYGVGPLQMARAMMHLRQGYSHEKAARLALAARPRA